MEQNEILLKRYPGTAVRVRSFRAGRKRIAISVRQHPAKCAQMAQCEHEALVGRKLNGDAVRDAQLARRRKIISENLRGHCYLST